MGEAELAGVQGLAGENGKAVVDELLVLAEYCALYYTVAAIGDIAEEGMADELHVYTYLVGAAGLQAQLYERYIVEPLQHFIVCNSVLAMVAIGEGVHDLAEAKVAAYVGLYGSFVLFHIAPDKGNVSTVYSMCLELRG